MLAGAAGRMGTNLSPEGASEIARHPRRTPRPAGDLRGALGGQVHPHLAAGLGQHELQFLG